MALADTSLDETGGQQISVTMNPARAEKLFAGSGHTFAELIALVDAGKPVPGFALPSRFKATIKAERGEVESQNVAGILRGADAEAARRVRGRVGASRSSRHRRAARQRRPRLQRRHGQRVWRGRAARGRRAAARRRHQTRAIDPASSR